MIVRDRSEWRAVVMVGGMTMFFDISQWSAVVRNDMALQSQREVPHK